MKINTIVNRYIFREMIPPFVVNTIFFTFVFLMTKILEITNLIINYKISLSTVLWMLIYSIPTFLQFVIPMSVMMAVLLTFLRLSGDNEITALKAGGVSLYGVLFPVLAFCAIGFLLTAFMAIHGLVWGRLALKDITSQATTSYLHAAIKERTFNDAFKDVMLYVGKIDIKTKALQDVFIEDRRTPGTVGTVVAPEGKIFMETAPPAVRLHLLKGSINQVEIDRKSVNTVHFETYDIRLDLKQPPEAAGGPKHIREMTLAELRAYVGSAEVKDNRYFKTLLELHKKLSLPAACFALGILAVPLGIQSRTSKKSYGILIAMFFFLAYYLLLSAGWVFGETGVYPPAIGMWVPNLVMGGIGLFLLARAAGERTLFVVPSLRLLVKKGQTGFRSFR
jgi:lipopolysaccharide export system permease protein